MFKPKLEFNKFFTIFYFFILLFALFLYEFDFFWVYSYMISFIIGSFGIAFGYHRLIIHKCVDTFKPIKNLAAFIALLSNTGSAVTWATSHYLHHAFPDSENDPHAPTEHKYKILLGFYNTDAIIKNQKKVFSAIRSIANDKYLIHLHKNYYLYLFGFYTITFLFGGFKGLLFFGLIPSGLSFYSIVLTNYFNHGNLGYRNFETLDQSRNVWFLFPFTYGENWHNNHHKFPSSITTRSRWWELDLPVIYCVLFDRKKYIPLLFKIKKIKSRWFAKSQDYVY